MKILKEEELNKEFVSFWDSMEFAGIQNNYSQSSLKAVLSTSAAGTNEDSGLAYPGALLVHINLVTNIAQRLAKMVSGTFKIDLKSLTKVCLLQHLSKSAMFTINDNEWEVKNRGMNYKFTELEGRLKSGERSIMYAMQNNIHFSAIEYEAMVCLDRENEANGARFFDSPMTMIVRQANEMATMIAREKAKINK